LSESPLIKLHKRVKSYNMMSAHSRQWMRGDDGDIGERRFHVFEQNKWTHLCKQIMYASERWSESVETATWTKVWNVLSMQIKKG